MRAVAFVLAFFLAAPIAAQTIHGHPQKQAYGSPTEWPSLNGQCWVNDPDPIKAGHIHVVPKAPLYATVTDIKATMDVPFTIMAHNIAGSVGLVIGEHLKSIKWDATGTSTPPDMKGDPNGLLQWTGVATFDHTLGDDGFLHLFQWPVHGWAQDRIFTRTNLDNGRRLDTVVTWSLYSAVDLTAPETPSPQQGNPGVNFRVACTEWTPEGSTVAGEVINEVSDYIPLAPISTPWTTIANVYNYTAPVGVVFPDQTFNQVLDADLHHGVRGTLQRTLTAGPDRNKQFLGPIVIDPAVLGSGNHTQMITWTQPVNGEAASAVMVFPVVVGPGTPVPTICLDPTATNIGSALPCTYPDPAPVLCTNPLATNVGRPVPCVFPPPPVDVCPNIDGAQSSVPDGLILSNGQCVPPPPPPMDVCPNIPGAQATVPDGLVLLNGQCVPPPPPPTTDLAGSYVFSAPGGVYTFTCDSAGKCTLVIK